MEFTGFKRARLLVLSGLLLAAIGLVVYDRMPKPAPDVLSNQRQTEHFNIHTDLDSFWLDYYDQVFEGFFKYFEENYFKIPQKRPLTVYLFKNEHSYKPCVQKLVRFYTPYGFYMGSKRNIIVVNRDSGLGTATHELVHYFIDAGFSKKPPKWIDEGIATFFEKFIGHIDHGRLDISFGYFSDWRFPITKAAIDKLSLEKIINSPDPDQCAVRSLMLFLHKKKLFTNCVRKWQTGLTDATGVKILEEVYGRSLAQIEEDWKAWVRSQPIDGNVKFVPMAFVLPQQEWQMWLSINKHKLYWNEEEKIYKVIK